MDGGKWGKQSGPVLGRVCDTEGCECGSAVWTSALALTAPLPLFLPLGSPTGDDDAIATLVLCLVHRRVGARDQLFRRLPVRRILGGADAHRQPPGAEVFTRHPRPEAFAHGGGPPHWRLDHPHRALLPTAPPYPIHPTRCL